MTQAQHSDPTPRPVPANVGGVGELDILKARCKFPPEPVDLAARVGVVGEDVVEGDQAAGCDQRRVHLEILANALIAVVSIDESELDKSGKQPFDLGKRASRVGVGAQQVELLTRQGVSSKLARQGIVVTATEAAARQVYTYNGGVRRGDAAPRPKASAAERAYLEHRARPFGPDEPDRALYDAKQAGKGRYRVAP